MRKFFIITADELRDAHYMDERELGKADLRILWSGKPIPDGLPSDIRLWISGKVPCDFLENPISWPIFSERFVETAWDMIHNHVQLLDAPLFDSKTDKPLPGYKIVNLLETIDAAVVPPGRKVSDVQSNNLRLAEFKVPPDVHFFRLGGSRTRLMASGELVKALKAARLVGIAYLETKTVD